jgi:hypothetical protein
MSGVLHGVIAASSGAPGTFPATLPASANALSSEYQVQNDGDLLYGNGAGGAGTTDWITPSDATTAAFYQVKTEVTSGSFSTDPSAGSYLDCSSTRTWIKSVAGTVIFNMTFREKASGAVRKVYTGMSITVT